jgi:hypothetical protein
MLRVVLAKSVGVCGLHILCAARCSSPQRRTVVRRRLSNHIDTVGARLAAGALRRSALSGLDAPAELPLTSLGSLRVTTCRLESDGCRHPHRVPAQLHSSTFDVSPLTRRSPGTLSCHLVAMANMHSFCSADDQLAPLCVAVTGCAGARDRIWTTLLVSYAAGRPSALWLSLPMLALQPQRYWLCRDRTRTAIGDEGRTRRRTRGDRSRSACAWPRAAGPAIRLAQ